MSELLKDSQLGESQRGTPNDADITAAPSDPTPTIVELQSECPEKLTVLTGTDGELAAEVCPPPAAFHPPQQERRSKTQRFRGKSREKTLEAQVAAFKAWETSQRTAEHIKPGVYRQSWIWLARCLTFFVPSWFLKNVCKMNDLRRRLAFRQKVLFCLLVAVIYGFLSYCFVIQPLASCVLKIRLGTIPSQSSFCQVVRPVIYTYMGMEAVFTLLVAVCAARVRYTSRAFEEHDALLVMHVPCYNEDESVLRKTIDSCIDSTYEKKRKLFIVADGTVAAPGQKPTYRILLEDIFNHQADLEAGIDDDARPYTSFDTKGASENLAFCCTGYFRDVPYVIVVKVGRADERDQPKPGNRGKRDSQLLVYNFFHYVNYRGFGNSLFAHMENKMRICLNINPEEAMYMLVVDLDTEVRPTGISYLVHQLQKDPTLIGVCGYTGVSNPFSNLVTCSQVFEYWLTHAVLKAVESVCSNVLVLSGCFTIYRLKWPDNQPAIVLPGILKDYAGSYEKTLHEHNLLSIEQSNAYRILLRYDRKSRHRRIKKQRRYERLAATSQLSLW